MGALFLALMQDSLIVGMGRGVLMPSFKYKTVSSFCKPCYTLGALFLALMQDSLIVGTGGGNVNAVFQIQNKLQHLQ